MGQYDKFSGQSALQESIACSSTNTVMAGVSPGKAVDLGTKNYEQLRYLQQLYDDGILDRGNLWRDTKLS